MTTLYNKTALKKIKKNDLVLMFLDLQASDYNARMDDRKLKNITPFLEEEIKELNEKIEGLREKLDIGTEQHFADCAKLNKFHRKIRDEYDRLKEDITIHPDYQRLVELD